MSQKTSIGGMNVENKSTVEIHEELASREGVTEIIVGPYETFQIVQDQRTHEFTGPARVLISRNCVQCNSDLATLHCFEEKWICESCAQINSERGNEMD